MQLPVSGMEVAFRAPDGSDDLTLIETQGGAVARALAVLPRLARLSDSDGAAWRRLTVTDFEAALMGLRRFLFGDRICCIYRCPSADCGRPMEPEFSITAFLDDVTPQTPPDVSPSAGDGGWFALAGAAARPVRFRLPAVADQAQVLGSPRAAQLLIERCVQPQDPADDELARVMSAMETMAPLVSRPLEGECPECGRAVTMPMHVPKLVMDELRLSAAGVHDDIDSIARSYHWEEAAILALPQGRRQTYAELIRRRERAS